MQGTGTQDSQAEHMTLASGMVEGGGDNCLPEAPDAQGSQMLAP